jgi:hypothetical protein
MTRALSHALTPIACLALMGQTPEARLKRDVTFLASPALAGRGNGDEGLERATAYIARSYRRQGLKPVEQRYAFLARVKRESGNASLGGRPLAWGTDLEAVGFSADADLALVPIRFVGCGLQVGDYDDLGEVKGQAAVIFRKLPEVPAFVHLRRMETSLLVRIQKLEAAGAALVIVVEEGDAPAPLMKEEGPSKAGLPILSMPARTLPGLDLPALKARIAETGRAQAAPLPGALLDLKLTLRREEARLPNLAVTIPGRDPRRRGEVIVVGAHMDHLGLGGRHSMGGEAARGSAHPGADDNASGTAMVMALARHFHHHPPARSILFLHFSGEEEGLLGSANWIQHPTVPLPSVKFMVNLDMVGRLDPAKPSLLMGGLGAPRLALDHASTLAPAGIKVGTDIGASVGGSDHMSFSAARIPTFFFFTGLHADYHRPTDTADKVNYPGMVQVEGMVERVVEDLADARSVPAFDPETAKLPASKDTAPMNVSFGTLPDYTENPSGFRINGTSTGGTAEAAGLKGGDIIIQFGAVKVRNIYDYMAALGTYKPGDKVAVTWLRDGQPMQVDVILKGR